LGERKQPEIAPGAFALDRAGLFDLADIAIDAARRAGADYVDIRLGETRREFLRAREDRLEDVGESADAGFGLRVLRDGCWGFYGASTFSRAAILTGVETALANARAVKPIQPREIILETLPGVEARWETPFGIDPFEVSVADKADFLLSVNAAARDAGEKIGWPVVLKGVAEGVAHKTERGLVRANLRDAAALQAAYESLGTEQAIVQPMVPAALEAIAGITRSPGVGLVLLCGLGGIYAEALRDACVWPIPVTRETIERKLAQSSLGRVLASARWQYPEAARAFIDLLLALQKLAATLGDRLEAVDINPVMLGPAGAIAVDALVVPRG